MFDIIGGRAAVADWSIDARLMIGRGNKCIGLETYHLQNY
jgi:hypothetical protein